jgi:hypothetical protein
MGNWYTNVSLKDVNQADVVAQLNELGRVSIVTPLVEGWLVVFDQECDKFDIDILESLALTLSTNLQCTAIASLNADDDILWFAVYANGSRISRYASALGEFEDAKEFPPPRQFSETLCRIFNQPERARSVGTILNRGHGVFGLLFFLVKIRFAYVLEIQRHQDLASVLALPVASVGFGYNYVARGELPTAISADMLLRTNGA